MGEAAHHLWSFLRSQIELLNIQETISNPAIVRLRMQFWKDAVNAISNVSRRSLLPSLCSRCPSFLSAITSHPALNLTCYLLHSQDNPPPSHPIALLLARTSTPSTRDLTAYYLNQIIEARVRTTSLHNSSFLSSFSLLSHPLFFVSQSSPPSPSLSLTALLTSLTKTSTPLHLLSLSLLSPPNSSSPNPPPHVTASLQHLSLASGLVALLRSLPRDAAQRRTLSVLPLDLCATHGLVTEDVYRLGGGAGGRLGEGGGGVKEVVWEVACRANDELATARKEWEEKGGVVPKEYRALFLSGVGPSLSGPNCSLLT